MPESPGLYLRLTVMENLECFAGLYELDDARGRIERALRAVNLLDRVGDACGSLSKGLRQRVALSRAVLNDPAALFLDEPTSGLDPVATREVHELIASLRERGVTIFLTTHRLEEAERLCDRVAILNTTLRLIGRPDELRAKLFRRSLDVRLRVPLADPKTVFSAVREVEGWEQAPSSGGYALASSDVRAAQQLSVLANLPPLAIVALVTFNVITPSTSLAVGLAAALLALDALGWRAVGALFDRERLITGVRS